MSPLSALEAAAVPTALIAWFWLAYRHQQRHDARMLSVDERWRQRMDERYRRLEFDVQPLEPMVYDWEQADAQQDAA